MRTRNVIMVVCRGNIVRSPFAAAILKQELRRHKLQSGFRLVSRGVQGTIIDPEPVKHVNITFYPELYAEARPMLEKRNIDLSDHVSTRLSATDMANADLVLAMDDVTKANITALFPGAKRKVHLFSELDDGRRSIADPESNATSTQQILEGIDNIATRGVQNLLTMTN